MLPIGFTFSSIFMTTCEISVEPNTWLSACEEDDLCAPGDVESVAQFFPSSSALKYYW